MSVQEYESKDQFLRFPFVVDRDELTSLPTVGAITSLGVKRLLC